MKQVGLTSYEEVYDSFMTLLAAPAGPWQKGRLAWTYWNPWWTDVATLQPDEDFLHKYPNCVQLQEIINEHFKQLVSSSPPPTSLLKLMADIARGESANHAGRTRCPHVHPGFPTTLQHTHRGAP